MSSFALLTSDEKRRLIEETSNRWKQGRVSDDLKDARTSGRVGSTGRTFHCRVASYKRGELKKAVGGLAYDKRQDGHEKRRDELESEGGRTTPKMSEILEAAEAANTRANGKFALDFEIELPVEFDAEQRRAVAEQIAQWFEAQGCPGHWAVHSHNERGVYQPHLHMTTTARAVRRINGQWIGTNGGSSKRGASPPVIDGPEAMKSFRREIVAGAINAVAHPGQLAAAWHGGRLEETGINRPAKKRRPMVAIKAAERATNDDHGLAATHAAIDAGDYQSVIDARKRFAEKRAADRAEKAATKVAEKPVKAPAQTADPTMEKAAEKAVRPLNEAQRAMLKDRLGREGLEIPADADTNAAWQSLAFALVKSQNRGDGLAQEKAAALRELRAAKAERDDAQARLGGLSKALATMRQNHEETFESLMCVTEHLDGECERHGVRIPSWCNPAEANQALDLLQQRQQAERQALAQQAKSGRKLAAEARAQALESELQALRALQALPASPPQVIEKIVERRVEVPQTVRLADGRTLDLDGAIRLAVDATKRLQSQSDPAQALVAALIADPAERDPLYGRIGQQLQTLPREQAKQAVAGAQRLREVATTALMGVDAAQKRPEAEKTAAETPKKGIFGGIFGRKPPDRGR